MPRLDALPGMVASPDRILCLTARYAPPGCLAREGMVLPVGYGMLGGVGYIQPGRRMPCPRGYRTPVGIALQPRLVGVPCLALPVWYDTPGRVCPARMPCPRGYGTPGRICPAAMPCLVWYAPPGCLAWYGMPRQYINAWHECKNFLWDMNLWTIKIGGVYGVGQWEGVGQWTY